MGVILGTYKNRQLAAACAIGSLAAWGMIVIPLAFLQLWDSGFSNDGWHQAANAIILLGLFGIPVALLFGLFVGFPAMKLANRLERNSYWDALAFGAATGLIIGILILAFSLIHGLGDYLDDSMRGSSGDGYGNLWDNGMPTTRGWLFELRTLVQLTCIGAIAGTTVRWRLGPLTQIAADAPKSRMN